MKKFATALCLIIIFVLVPVRVYGVSDSKSEAPNLDANGPVVFARNGDLWLMLPDGSGLRQLTNDSGYSEPTWSRGGSKIAYVRAFTPEGSTRSAWEVGMYDVSTGQQQIVVPAQLTPFVLLGNYYRYYNARWSPDDTQLYYIAADGRAQGDFTHKVNVNTLSRDANFTSFHARSIDISPTSGWIVYTEYFNAIPIGNNLSLASPDGRTHNEIIPLVNEVSISSPRWSPDGDEIAFKRSGTFDLSGSIEIVDSSGAFQRQYPVGTTNAWYSILDWSPDATQIVYESDSSLYFLELLSGIRTSFTYGKYPSWSDAIFSISGHVEDDAGNPLEDVWIATDSGYSARTDSQGNYFLVNVSPGIHNISSSKYGYGFTPGHIPVELPPNREDVNFTGINASALVSELSQYADDSRTRIDMVQSTAQGAAEDGDYFGVQKEADEIRLVADVIVDTANVLSTGFDTVAHIEDMTKMEMPGVLGRGWGHVINLRNQYEPAKDAFREALFVPVTSSNIRIAANEFFNGAHIYFAADFTDQLAEELLTDSMIKNGLQVGLQSDLALTTRVYPAHERLAGIYKQDIADTMDDAIAQLPYMSVEDQAEYILDLQKRESANIVMATTLDRRSLPLQIARAAREAEDDSWLPSFLISYLIKGTALLYADGIGVLAIEIGNLGWNLYQNIQRLQEDIKMMTMGVEGLGGALNTQKRIYLNAVHGIDNITEGITPQISDGSVTSIQNFTVGSYTLFGRWFWWERSSYSDIHLDNMADYDTDFQALGRYGNTGLMGRSYEPLLAEGTSGILANQPGVLRINYNEDGQGASPDEDSTVEIDILGSTDTGTYYISHTGTTWQPAEIDLGGNMAIRPAKASDDTIPTLPYPVRSYVEVQSESLNYVPYIWVDNPFTQTLMITLTQPLPTSIQVIDPNGGVLDDATLTWAGSIPPETTQVYTHMVTYEGPSGSMISYPGARLTISDGANTATFTSTDAIFETEVPLVGKGVPPSKMFVEQEVSMPITITNRSNVSESGTVKLLLIDLQGIEVYSTEKDIVVPGENSVPTQLPFNAPSDADLYIITAEVTSNGGSMEIFHTYVKVLNHQVLLPIINVE